MKKLILTVTASLACVAAFAQGKVLFSTDSLHLAYYSATAPGDAALQGQGVASTALPAGITLVADLYAGTSSTSLSLVSTTTFGAVPGKWNQLSVAVPGVVSGTVFLLTQIRDSAFAAPATQPGAAPARVGGTYWGVSQLFSFTLGTSVTYPAMYGANNGGTWAAGTFNMDQYGVGSRGAIAVSAVPEPASFALAGLGAAALLIFRRRK